MWGGTAAAAGPPKEGTELEPPPRLGEASVLWLQLRNGTRV